MRSKEKSRRHRANGRTLAVRVLSPAATRGTLTIGPFAIPCALGRSGQQALKREGDGATPVGRWPFRCAYFRRDRIAPPRTALRTQPTQRDDGWCDAPGDRNYNRPVRLPYPASAEEMWRRDHLYDLVVVLGYNDRPRRRGAGSAIFLHIARDGYLPTEGCIAVARRDIVRLVSLLRPGDAIRVGR